MKLYKSKTWTGWKNHDTKQQSTFNMYRRQVKLGSNIKFLYKQHKIRVKLSISEFNFPKCGRRITTQSNCIWSNLYLQFQREINFDDFIFKNLWNSFSSCLSITPIELTYEFFSTFLCIFLFISIHLVEFGLKYIIHFNLTDTQEIYNMYCTHTHTYIRMNWNL